MVTSMAGAVAGLAGTALSGLAGIGGVLSNQSRAPVSAAAPRTDTSTVALAQARDRRTLRAAERNAQQERLVALLSDPLILGLVTTFLGLWAAPRIPWSREAAANGALAGVAASAAVLMGLGRAGVGDLTTLALAAGGGLAAATEAASRAAGSEQAAETGASGGTAWPWTWHIGGTPVLSVFGPIPTIEWGLGQLFK